MSIMYKSTRSNGDKVTASQAILKGLAEDGGLFVPDGIPGLEMGLETLADLSYKETAYEVMKLFLSDFTKEELMYCIDGAYDDKFDTEQIAPLVKKDGAYYLELFHGKTIAFKDMALSILPYLMTTSAKKNGVKNEIVILTATSGDTGKAALAGFADVPGTSIIVFYPKNGVSPIQERQMLTQTGENTHVVGILGNFDDAQTGVKKMFGSKELAAQMNEAGYQFSSANSINIGRLVPQIVYYVYAYGRERSPAVRRLMWWFLRGTLEIYWQHIMLKIWAFRSTHCIVRPMKIKYYLTFLIPENMTEKESLSLQRLPPWIFLFPVT